MRPYFVFFLTRNYLYSDVIVLEQIESQTENTHANTSTMRCFKSCDYDLIIYIMLKDKITGHNG